MSRSASRVYTKALQKAITSPVPPTTKSREQLEAEIADISQQLKGPMDSATRIDLCEARAHRRKQLEALA